jgi:polysaccharide export outer membrane protein
MQKKREKILNAVLFLAVFFLISCNILAQEKQVSPTKDTKATEKTVDRDKTEIKSSNSVSDTPSAQNPATAILAAKMMQDNTRRYRIGVNDELDIQVFRHPEYSQTVRVNEYGLIMLPRVDEPVEAICRTENELAADIVKFYSKYLRQPYVRVYVKEFKSQPVAVIGAVDKPGQFNLNRKMRLIEAVAVAGGPTDKAGARITLARLGSQSVCEKPEVSDVPTEEVALSKLLYSYNLKKMLEGDEASNPWMLPGDIVSISEADKAFVVGNVKEPKAIQLKTQRTLTQAIAEAGGVLEATKKKEIFLIREDGVGNKTRTPVNLILVSQGKASDPILQPNDIIEVPTDSGKATRNSIIKAFTNGLPSVLPFIIP